MSLTHIILSLGSNSADAHDRVKAIIESLGEIGTLTAESGIYSTSPMSGIGNCYANAVVELTVATDEQTVVDRCHALETKLGRDRASKNVTADIDLIYFGNRCTRPNEIGRSYFAEGFGRLLQKSPYARELIY